MTDAQDTAEAKKVLLAQARKLKMEVDGRWSVETLAEKVQEAIEAAAQQEQAAIAEASDTWIYCLRDCFVGTEKHPAGTVAKAPKDLYQRFKAVGAARLADEDEVQGA